MEWGCKYICSKRINQARDEMSEWNLSDKIIMTEIKNKQVVNSYIEIRNIKEFIRRLKEEFKEIKLSWYKIDKLAGEKLV